LVTGRPGFSAVAAGGSSTCAISSGERKIYCRGQNDVGQLGDDTPHSRATRATVSGSRRFSTLASTPPSSTKCAIGEDGSLYCRGSKE